MQNEALLSQIHPDPYVDAHKIIKMLKAQLFLCQAFWSHISKFFPEFFVVIYVEKYIVSPISIIPFYFQWVLPLVLPLVEENLESIVSTQRNYNEDQNYK